MRYLIPAFTVVCALTLSGCWDKKPPGAGGHQMPPPQVGVATPISRALAPVKELTGSIEAVDTVILNPRVNGVVVKVHVADGAEVKAGDAILDIDDLPLKATLARMQAQVASAEARQALAKLQFERGKRLVQDQVISRQLFDDQEAALRSADADVAAAKAGLLTAELDFSYAKVVAPISGRISKIQTTVGNLVQGGGPVPPTHLTTLVSIDPVYVTFDVDEGTWQHVGGRLRAATAGGDAVAVSVALMGEKGFPHVGQVVFVDNRIDNGSGAIRVRARIPNADRRLTPGAFARVQMETGPSRPVLLVHERAVQAQLNTRYVFGVDKDGVTSFRPVQLGAAVGDLRVVEHGLSAEDQVVVVGLAKIFYPGMPVNPALASMETLEFATPPADDKGAPDGAPAAEKATKVEAPNKTEAPTKVDASAQEGAKP